MWIVVCGNPIDGFEYYGPFDDESIAERWGREGDDGANEWWVAHLTPQTT